MKPILGKEKKIEGSRPSVTNEGSVKEFQQSISTVRILTNFVKIKEYCTPFGVIFKPKKLARIAES